LTRTHAHTQEGGDSDSSSGEERDNFVIPSGALIKREAAGSHPSPVAPSLFTATPSKTASDGADNTDTRSARGADASVAEIADGNGKEAMGRAGKDGKTSGNLGLDSLCSQLLTAKGGIAEKVQMGTGVSMRMDEAGKMCLPSRFENSKLGRGTSRSPPLSETDQPARDALSHAGSQVCRC
jgi:hypothetical protein